MTMKKTQPEGEAYKAEDGKITATVKSGEEYAFVINEYNKAAAGTALYLTIDGTIDMMGAACFIENSKGNITITGTNNAVIKNMTSNRSVTTSTANASGKESDYSAAVLIAYLSNDLTINNVTFENLNVKAIYAGGVAALVGYSKGSITLGNVTIKDSTIIGHRDVSAVFGSSIGNIIVNGNVTLENVNVMTVGGRAALFGRFSPNATVTVSNNVELINKNSKVSIYESKVSEQKFVDGSPTECPTGWDSSAWTNKTTITGQERYIYSVKNPEGNGKDKEYSVYGYRSDAVILRQQYNNSWIVYTSLADAAKK